VPADLRIDGRLTSDSPLDSPFTGAYTRGLDHQTMPNAPDRHPGRSAIWAAMLVLYIVWGSTYLGIAIAVETIPPFAMAALRFAVAGSILLGWSVVREGRAFAIPPRQEWRDSAIVGALLLGGGMGMVAFGEQTVPSGITALLVAMMPVWVAVLGWLFLRERLPRLAMVGIVVGFVGVTILVGPSAVGGSGALDPLGLTAILISPISWATGSLFASHRASLPERPLVATGLQMLSGGVVLTVMAAASGQLASFDPEAVSQASIVALLYLTIIGSILAFTTFGWLLRVAPLPLVTTYAYVNPVVAVILGQLILGEAIDLRTVIAGSVIILAVALIITSRGRMRDPRPIDDPGRAPADPDIDLGRATPLGETSPPRPASG
jgi:drug/metabolite transporter (DMT)-like permease